MPQAGHSSWGGTLSPLGPPYLSASCPLKYAWTYSVKAVATGSVSCEPSTTGLGPRDSPGEADGVRARMGPPPCDPPLSPLGPTQRWLGDGEEAPLAQAGRRRVRGAAAPGGRGAQRARLQGKTASRRGSRSGPRYGGPAARPHSPPTPATHQVGVAARSRAGRRPLRAGAARGGHEWDLPGGCAGPGGESIWGGGMTHGTNWG